MPIYEYQCKICHHHFDVMQKISEAPVTQCPKCSEHSVIKLVSAAGFQLKGTGWYATDFKNKPAPGSSKSETSPSSTASSDSGASSSGTKQGGSE